MMGPDEALFTDLYELTMLQAYFDEGLEQEAVFDLLIRSLPETRNFLVACGLEQVLEYLERLQFSPAVLQHLDSLELFSNTFLDYLGGFRFRGNVRAFPEGTIVFPGEPILEVSAPLPQAQLVETFLLNQMTFQTMIASKGARTVLAAEGKTLVDFGSRRAHGTDAALKAARALYIAGYASTSNVLAGRLFGIPVAGTMAHSYIQAHETETEAFRRFVESYPATVLLVDTYDTLNGVRAAAKVMKEMAGQQIRAVRLDSGNLGELSKSARRILDEAGLSHVGIFASGGLDETGVAALLGDGAPIDGFGVGTSAVVSSDAPQLDSAYKLVVYADKPRLKLSEDKETLPGRKQVFRHFQEGLMNEDVIGLADEHLDGQPLLQEVMVGGRRLPAVNGSLESVRKHVGEQLAKLPMDLRALRKARQPYRVSLSDGLTTELDRVRSVLRE